MTNQSTQIGDHAKFERTAATALGANSIANHDSNNIVIDWKNVMLVHNFNNFDGGSLAGSRNLSQYRSTPMSKPDSISKGENGSSSELPNTGSIVYHTQKAIRCFKIMNEQLQQDMMDVGIGPAQYLTNAQFIRLNPKNRDKISQELKDACTEWAKHLKEADRNDESLINKLKTFVKRHLLHWIEALSWINKLGSADPSLEVAIAFLESMPALSTSSEVLSEGQRLISNFGDLIAQAALHTYRTALPLMPNESPLYQTYRRETRSNPCQVLSWRPEDLHGIITRSQHQQPVDHIVFSCQPSTYFASWSVGFVNIWNSTTGTNCKRITAENIALADNFTVGASSQESSVFFHNFPDPNTPHMVFTASAPVLRIALSFDGRRLAAGSSDGKIILWDVANSSLQQEMDGFDCNNQEYCQFVFSPNGPAGARLAFSSRRGGLEFRKAVNGEHIANLNYLDYEPTIHFKLVFSRSGSRLASLVKGEDEKHILTLWNVVNGALLGASPGSVGSLLAMSPVGSLIATGGDGHPLQLWSGDRGDILTPPDLNSLGRISYLAFSQDDMLVVGFTDADSVLYDVHGHSIVARIPKHNPSATSFSPDHTRLAIGFPDGTLHLWDMSSFKASRDMSRTKSASVSILTFSPDCSRLASGFEDGTIRVWDTECQSQPLAIYKHHSARVTALAFSLDGLSFASGAADGTIGLWDTNGVESTELAQFPNPGELTSVAFSCYDLAATATVYETIIWDIRTHEHHLVCQPGSTLLSFSNPNHAQPSRLLASFNRCYNTVMVWDLSAKTCIAHFSDIEPVEKMVFTADNSQLVGTVRLEDGTEKFCLFDLADKAFWYLRANEFARLFPMPFWQGIPVWLQYEDGNYTITGFSPEDNDRSIGLNMVVLSKHLIVDSCKPCRSGMFALLCKDGRILLFKSLYKFTRYVISDPSSRFGMGNVIPFL